MSRRTTIALLLSCVMGSLHVYSQPKGSVGLERERNGNYQGDPLTVKTLNPNVDLFPDASLVDFSYLLEPPAGRRGFVRVGPDARLQFEDATPARFWGVVIDQQNIGIPKHMIDIVLETLARAGVNMIRLHAMDNRTGERYGVVRQNIIDEAHPNSSRYLDEEVRDRVDYWIGAAKKRGIYSYLGFRAFRTFRGGDGVPNADSLDRGARPYAIFNKRLIELQKEYIDSLAVFHTNPYTGLTYANEPAIACFELLNDDDMLFRPEVWSAMPQPYWSEFNRLWNEWLIGRYKTTARLKAAWTNSGGISALASQESLERRNVRLPSMDLMSFEQATLSPYYDPVRSPARRSDAVRFAMEVQSRYFKELRDHAVQRGIKVPLHASVRTDLKPMTFTVRAGLDMTSGNVYQDHPAFLAGEEWMGQEFFTNRNYLAESGSSGFAPSIAKYHWSDKPGAIREWSTCWPNVYRGGSILETAAYSLFQGFDLVTHFNYTTVGSMMGIGTFGLQADPVRWGMFGLAAKMFLSGDVRQAQRTVAILFSEEDLTTYANYESPLYQLAWMHKVVNRSQDARHAESADLTITSGRSHTGRFEGRNGILFALTPFVDTQKQRVATERMSLYAQAGYPLPMVIMRSDTILASLGGFESQARARWGFRIEDVNSHGYIPIGSDRQNVYSAGFRDTVRNVLALGGIPEQHVLPLAARMMNETYKTPTLPEMFDGKIFQSDTRELTRKAGQGLLLIHTKTFCAIQGALGTGKRLEAGVLAVTSQSPVGVLAATSLDGAPLDSSSIVLLKMTTVAENYGQVLDTVDLPSMGKRVLLRSRGGFPVTTKGVPTQQPTTVWLNGKKFVDVYMKNGTWEIVMDRTKKQYAIYSDTPNIRLHLYPDEPAKKATLVRYLHAREPLSPQEASTDLIYPGFSKYIGLTEQ